MVQVCSEMKLFGAVVMWVQHKQLPREEIALALNQLLPLVRFPLMSLEELEVLFSCTPHRCHVPFLQVTLFTYLYERWNAVELWALIQLSVCHRMWLAVLMPICRCCKSY